MSELTFVRSKTMCCVALALCLLVSPGITFAQPELVARIEGIVFAGETPVGDARVTVERNRFGVREWVSDSVTDGEGKFSVEVPGSGVYLLTVEADSFPIALQAAAVQLGERIVRTEIRLRRALNDAPTAQLEDQPNIKSSIGGALAMDLPLESLSFSGPWARMVEPRPAATPPKPAVVTGANRLRAWLSYELRDSALDTAPYSLTETPAAKPEYASHALTAALTGPVGRATSRTTFSAMYSASRSSNPFTQFARVPTARERLGDFSQTHVSSGPNAGQIIQIIDPTTGLPFPGNRLPPGRVDRAAASLLRFTPLPNHIGAQNFFRGVSADNRSDSITVSVNKVFTDFTNSQKGPSPVSNIGASINYASSGGTVSNVFPDLGGNGDTRTLGLSMSHTYTLGSLSNSANVLVNRTKSDTHNGYAFERDVAGELGITGVSSDPFDWGIPAISLVNYTGLFDVAPFARKDQTIRLTDSMRWSRGRHSVRWGGELRVVELDQRSSANSRGTFVFTGFATALTAEGRPVPGTGYDLADFLLGLPQRTTVQFTDRETSFRQRAWNLFVQDDWRIANQLTVDAGIRYDFAPPYTEANDHMVNLDVQDDFAAVVPVGPNDVGRFTGRFPAGLIDADTNNFAPRLGIAWRAANTTTVRGSYGVSYDVPSYATLAQRMGQQPPHAVVQTGVAMDDTPLTLRNGFPQLASGVVALNFAADRALRAAFVQTWTVELQQQLRWGTMLSAAFVGALGDGVALLRAPNRVLDGTRTADAQPFLWQSSQGSSRLTAATLRLQKEFSGGSSVESSYVLSKSMDNVPSLGGSEVPQNDRDLNAEWARSNFDQRHRLDLSYAFELPFGSDHRWLQHGAAAALLGDWSLRGQLQAASGQPFTARVLADYADVARAPYAGQRANATGASVAVSDPSLSRYFNTEAFVAPASGRFGNAGRNTIPGPGSFLVNMTLVKAFRSAQAVRFEFRVNATNVFNTPQWTNIDTYVDSPTYGRVISAGALRRLALSLQARF